MSKFPKLFTSHSSRIYSFLNLSYKENYFVLLILLASSAYKWLAFVYKFKLCGDKDETMNLLWETSLSNKFIVTNYDTTDVEIP